MAAITLIKTARQSLRQWRSLPPEERERLRNDADRVRQLTVELGGSGRDRAVVAAELKEAIGSLSRAVTEGAASAAVESSRTLRYGSRAASFGLRRVRDRRAG